MATDAGARNDRSKPWPRSDWRTGCTTSRSNSPGGQQQRVGIARALVKDPAILLADEPTGNLDTTSSREIMWIIQELNRQSGITVVIVTHERDIAAQAARVVTMLDGKVLDDTRQEPVLVPEPGLT